MNLLKDGRMILSLLIPKYLYHRLFIIYLHGLILEKSNKKVSGFYFAASKKYWFLEKNYLLRQSRCVDVRYATEQGKMGAGT